MKREVNTMNNEIQEIIQPDIVISSDYSDDMAVHFGNLPRVAIALVTAAKSTLAQIERMLASATSFIQTVKACVPEQTFRAILTDEQKGKIATGASKENITIEPILLNGKNGVYLFPSTQDRIFGYTQLCVKATTIIAVDPNYKPPLPKHRHKFQKTPKPKLHKRSKTITQRP